MSGMYGIFSLFLGMILLGLILFGVIAYFTGTGLKESKKKLHQFIFSNWGKELKDRYYEPFCAKVKKLLFQAVGPIYESIKQVSHTLKEHIACDDYLYQVPWYAMVGDAGSLKSDLLKSLKLSHPIGSPRFGLPENNPLLSWWFFEKGIIVDVAEECLYTTEKDDHKTGWRTFLKALSRYRPHRPLDGIILTVPAEYFYGKNKLSSNELQKRSERISDQLIETEKFLGFKLPVYVVMAGLEIVPGFKGFCREILPSSRQDIFGWSNHYPTNMPYQSDWITEAFKSIELSLFDATLGIFSRGGVEDYGDDLMIFLKEFSSLKEGVGTYLDGVFRVNDYRDPFILRGIYQAGVGQNSDLQLESINPQRVNVLSVPSQSTWFFIKDLFQDKIFPENGIALPIKRFIRSTNRIITYLKIAIMAGSIVGLVSLYAGYGYMTRVAGELQPLLVKILQDLHVNGTKISHDDSLSDHMFGERINTILTLVAKTSDSPLSSPLLLPSIASSLNTQLYQRIIDIYNVLIASLMHDSFDRKADQIIKGILPEGNDIKINIEQIYRPVNTPEFLAFKGYVEALEDLESHVTLYNTLEETNDVASLEKVIHYLYGFNFPDAFKTRNSSLKDKLMQEARYRSVNLEAYNLLAEKRLYLLHNNFLERIGDPAYIYGVVSKLQETLEHLSTSKSPTAESFYEALIQIKEFIEFASLNGAAWLVKPEFNLGGGYKALIEKIKGISLFNEEMRTKLVKKSNLLHEKAVHYLKSYGSPITGYFLATSPATRILEPSKGLLTLEKGLGLFLYKPFMSKADNTTFARTVPNNQLLHWDRRFIKNAIDLIENYEDFVEDELPGYPGNIQDTLKVVGLDQLEHNIENILERAQTFFEVPAHAWGKTAEDAVRFQVDNVRQAGPLLVKLLSKLDTIGSKKTYTDLRALIFSQMYQNLKQLDRELLEGGYYLPLSTDLSWWKGDKKILLKAYGMQDKYEMQNYFNNQTQHVINMIKEYGAPVMEVLNADLFTMNIDEVVTVTRWNRLLQESLSYQNKKAVGSLKVLESFLVDEANEITQKDCLEKLNEDDMGDASGDYFLQKRKKISGMIFKQCQKVAAHKAVDQYNKIADYFNSFMANTFPFTNGIPNGSKIPADVSDKVLQEFFTEFDKLTPKMYEAIQRTGKYDKSWKEAQTFLLHMGKVRAFMDKYFAPKIKEGEPGLDFKVEFKQNEMRDKHGDQVLDWAVVVGDQTASLKEGNKPVRWEFGKNVAFGFQWAMDAPLQPTEIESIQALVKLGGRSMYVYQGYWALIRAILLHKTPPQEGGSTRNDTLLKFEIPLAPNPTMDPVDSALLFIRIIPQTSKGLSDLGFKIPVFPTDAPKLVKE